MGVKIAPKLLEAILYYSHTHLFDKIQIEMQIVYGVQPVGQNLLGLV